MTGQEYAEMVGENLKRIMKDKNISQSQLSKDLGFSKTTVSAWITGRRAPRIDRIDTMCQYLGCLRTDLTEPYREPVDAPVTPTIIPSPATAEAMEIVSQIIQRPELRNLFKAAVECDSLLILEASTRIIQVYNTESKQK